MEDFAFLSLLSIYFDQKSYFKKRHEVPSPCLLSFIHSLQPFRACQILRERIPGSGVTMITNRLKHEILPTSPFSLPLPRVDVAGRSMGGKLTKQIIDVSSRALVEVSTSSTNQFLPPPGKKLTESWGGSKDVSRCRGQDAQFRSRRLIVV